MSNLARLLIAVALILPLAGFGSCQQKPTQPKVEYVEVEKKPKVDKELLEPCPIEKPANLSIDEAVRVANARKLALQNCNEDKAALSKSVDTK